MLLFGFCPATVPCVVAQASDEQPEAPVDQAEAVIAPDNVATRATEVSNLLAELTTKFASLPEVDDIRTKFLKARQTIATEIDDAQSALQGTATIETLQNLQARWKPRQVQIGGWLDQLTQKALALQDALSRLENMHALWTRTRDNLRVSSAPPATLQQVEQVLKAIEKGQNTLNGQHDAVLNLQSRVSEEMTRCNDILARIDKAQKAAVAGLLTREREPIWHQESWTAARTVLPDQIHKTAGAVRTDIVQFVRDPHKGMLLQAVLLIVLIGVFSAARRIVKKRPADDGNEALLTGIFERPWAAAFFMVLFYATRYASPTPPMVQELYTALAYIPVLRLLQPVIREEYMPGLYGLGVLYVVDTLRGLLAGALVVEPLLLILEGLGGILLLGWLLIARKEAIAAAIWLNTRRPVVVLVIRCVLIYLAVGVVAAAVGHMRVARLIMSGTLTAGVLALALWAALRVICGAMAVALRLWPLRRLRMVQNHRDLLVQRAYRLLAVMAVLGWTLRLFERLGFLDPIQALGSGILAMKLERGSISISVGDVMAFLAAVGVSYLLSAFIRFTLTEEVYTRARIPSGTAYASSRLIHYSILALGFVIGLGLLGMDLAKVSVVAGALGVGIGFGLQSVVNNIVCGLIMLFERPVHVGDTVELDGIMGEVRMIGFRASSVRTWQGADIIIPNAQFITAKVTNWTFRDRLRRIDLPVSVAYASEPKQVIELLEGVARAHPQILPYPVPLCIFTSYGDSAINFELRVWIDLAADLTNVPQIRSDLNAAVYDAVKAAGMSFPFPQREVRLLGDPDSRASASDPAESPVAPGEMRNGIETNGKPL
jgi:small-conductance mechanosensitive channel